MKKQIALTLCVLLCSCAAQETLAPADREAARASAEQPAIEAREQNFIRETADALLDGLVAPEMTDAQRVQRVYRHLIENTYFAEPVGLDMWRYLSDEESPPTYVENRSLSPLLYGIGSCEDYAAAMVILLQQMGFSSEYVAGYTLSVDGEYVDHAWAVVELAGEWYHLDPQLEQNVTRDGLLTYRYFLKSDEELSTNHKWGENLIAYRPGISSEDAGRIRREYTPPACTAVYTQPDPETVTLPPRPDIAAINRGIEQARERSGKGELPPLELNTQAPVLIGSADASTPGGSRYARSFLSAPEQELYDALLLAAEGWEVGAELAVPAGCSLRRTEAVAEAFLQDNPLYYWVKPRTVNGAAGASVCVGLPEGLTAERARARQREIEGAAKALLDRAGPSQMDRVLLIHDYVAEHVVYDNSPEYTDSANLYGGLILGRGICDSYTKTFQYLMQMSGIDCIYIKGSSGRGVPHSWNAVRLADGWYYVDTTWNVNKKYRRGVFHDYLCVSGEEMSREHDWDTAQYPRLPASSGDTYDYYRYHGYAVEAGSPEDLTAQLAEAFLTRLLDTEPPGQLSPVFLEIKVVGSQREYEEVKAFFIKHIFDVLAAMSEQIGEENLPLYLQTGESITCNFNDTMQVILFYPKVRSTGGRYTV